MWLDARWTYAAEQLALFALAGALLTGRARIRFHWFLLIPAGAVAIGLLQLAAGWTVYAHETRVATLDWFTWLIAFWVAYQIFEAPGCHPRFLYSILVFAISISTVALMARFAIITNGVPMGRMGPFIYENQYANFVEMTLPLVLLAAADAPFKPWRYWLMAAVMIVSVFVSGSVTGTALVVAEAVLLLVVIGRRNGDFRPLAGVAVLAAGLAAVTGLGLLSLDLARENPLGARKQLTLASLRMVADRPLTGFGLGTWPTAYPAYARFDDGLFDNQAHDDWVQWAVEGGLPLFALMFAFAVGLARAALRSVWGIGLVVVLAHALIDYPFRQRPALVCFYFALAAALARDADS